MLLFGHSLLTALDFMGALLHGCGSSTRITQEIFPRVNISSSLPSLFTIQSLLTEKESSRKFASLRGSRVLPEKLLTQPYPQTRWDFSIILYCDSMQSLCIDYKDTRCNTWFQTTSGTAPSENYSYTGFYFIVLISFLSKLKILILCMDMFLRAPRWISEITFFSLCVLLVVRSGLIHSPHNL